MSERDAVGIWVRLAKCYGLLLRAVRATQRTREPTLAQFDVLAQLLRRPQGMTVGALSEALLVTAGNVTGLVGRMQARGWVTRRPSPDDARVRIVQLTAEGRRVARREVAHHERMLEHIFSPLSGAERRALIGSLDRLRGVLEP